MNESRKILVGPLDWGLGHASRCVPIIKKLIAKGFEVLIGAEGRSAAFLHNEFPALEIITLAGYNIRYPEKSNMVIGLGRQIPHIMHAIDKEHKMLDKLIDKKRIDAVISDNRFGLWSKRIPSIYITHQVTIKAPAPLKFAEGLLYHLHGSYIRRFNECWIPDFADKGGLSGDLAHLRNCRIPSYFIGPLSRFTPPANEVAKKYDMMFIISGPEPQRSRFEELIFNKLRAGSLNAIALTGRPGSVNEPITIGNTQIYPHMNTAEMREAMLSAGLIVCRPGYSSIMDLAALGCLAVFVPTPGQTEQEYLAKYHLNKGHYYALSQKQFGLEGLASAAKEYRGLKVVSANDVLVKRIDILAERIKQQ